MRRSRRHGRGFCPERPCWMKTRFLRPPHEDREDVVAVFGASRGRNRSAHFQHANVSGIFGGATLDLSEAHTDPGARVVARK